MITIATTKKENNGSETAIEATSNKPEKGDFIVVVNQDEFHSRDHSDKEYRVLKGHSDHYENHTIKTVDEVGRVIYFAPEEVEILKSPQFIVVYDYENVDPVKIFYSKRGLDKWIGEAVRDRSINFDSIRVFKVEEEGKPSLTVGVSLGD